MPDRCGAAPAAASLACRWPCFTRLTARLCLVATVALKETPLIRQYLSVKQKVPDALLFFRLGDFYEMFFEDAELGSRLLDIQLTSRSKDGGVPLCGVPYHAAEAYIAKLLKAGRKVAICEQATADGKGQKLLPRQIVRIITPGTVTEESVLEAARKSFLAALARTPEGFALAALDVSTGEFICAAVRTGEALREELFRLAPREVLVAAGARELIRLAAGCQATVTTVDGALFDSAQPEKTLSPRFAAEAATLAEPARLACAAALAYAEQTFGPELDHILPPRSYQVADYLFLDRTTCDHLELVATGDGERKGSLLGLLDETATAMGSRTLAHWILYPLTDLEAIRRRHDAVEELFEADPFGPIGEPLSAMGDLERLGGRVGSMRATPRDCLGLAQALADVARLAEQLRPRRSPLLAEIRERLDPLPELAAAVAATVAAEPAAHPRETGVIRPGFAPQVDEMRRLAADARGVIAELEARERERTAIPSLKVRYNQVFGFYLEVTKPHLARVPERYERKQTLVGAERFTTAELKELEHRILSAEAGLKELEARLFSQLVRKLASRAPTILATARAAGELDALLALARAARRRGYVRPAMNHGLSLRIRDGRHPVLEATMRQGEFVPNDVEVDPDRRQLLLITGPNMAGKSTYLRQLALIVVMAQMGSFVPATEAELGLCDRVLTRIGARDDLRRGESTFMVEMRETARLLAGLEERSLILLDEVGRGTSTYDGLAIAWSVAEHLHERSRAKVLFATHFHELVALAQTRPRVKNLSMAVREWNGEVIFLRRVVEQPASRSYGIEVARLAGLPAAVVARAREILARLEQGELAGAGVAGLLQESAQAEPAHAMQPTLFESAQSRVIAELKAVDPEALTPLEALNLLARLKEQLHGS